MADFDIEAARKSGYSDAEIADYLGAQSGLDVQAARQSGYKDAEIIEHLSPRPGFVTRALDTVGDAVKTADDYLSTQVANVAGGVASLPNTIANVADWGYNKLGIDPASIFGPQGAKVLQSFKNDFPAAPEITHTLLESGNKPEVNSGNRTLDAAVQGALSIPMMGGASVPALLAGALGGAGSEMAGQATEGTPLEVPARFGGALLGGGAGVLLPKAVKVAASTVRPFTEAGRESMAGRALVERAADPASAITSIESRVARDALPDDAVPGFRLNTGQASRDPGLMGMSDILPDTVRGTRAQANNAAVVAALDRVGMGLPDADDAGSIVQKALTDRFETGMKARSAAVNPLYEAAREFPEDLPVGRVFKATDEAIAATKGKPQRVMRQARSLLFDAKGKPDFSARGAVDARNAINEMLDSGDLGKFSQSLLLEMRSKLDDVLGAVPEEQAARAKFAEMSKPLEPFDASRGNKVVADVVAKDRKSDTLLMPAEKVPGQFMKGGALSAPTIQKLMMAAGGDPTVKRAMQSAYLADFRKAASAPVAQDAAGNPMTTAAGASRWLKQHRAGAANVLTQDQIKALDDITRHLTDQAQTVPGRVGSQTFDRLATESILGALLSPRFSQAPILEPINRALGVLYGGANKATLDRLTEAIADPKIAAALMKKATAGNVNMAEPVLLSIGRAGAIPVERAGQ